MDLEQDNPNPSSSDVTGVIDSLEPEGQGEEQGQDFGEWNERIPQDLREILISLAKDAQDEFKYPRRIEVMKAWKARSFWNELQHLTWNWSDECWDVLGSAAAGAPKGTPDSNQTAVLYTTNYYQGFGESFIAVITQSVPNLRFEPEDPDDAADIQTAEEADNLRRYIQHENDPIKLITKAAYFSWTDGRVHGWTRWEIDKRTGKPRETQSIYGTMEVKVPVIYDEMCDYPYLQFSREYHISTVRTWVEARDFEPGYYKQIKGGQSGKGQDSYERTARLSVLQGVGFKALGGDMSKQLCTVQRTWMRPSMFLSDTVSEELQPRFIELFPTGCYLETANGTYMGSRDASMDDEWAVENIMEGDGSNRPSKGGCMMSLQERINDICNITQDIYEKCIPASHWDDKMFDVDAFKFQVAMAGAKYGLNLDDTPLEGGDAIGNHVFFEPKAEVSADMLTYLNKLTTDVPEVLTGLSPILFGGGQGSDASGKALSIQQAAAMGRIGLPFRVLKRLYAKMMEQAVRCSARNRNEDIKLGWPDGKGQVERVNVRIEALSGNVRCFPDADENYPESYVAKRNAFTGLMAQANLDPVLHSVITNPKNMMMAKKLIGLEDFEIPDADAWNKQTNEIAILLSEVPTQEPKMVPNPKAMGEVETIMAPVPSIPIDVVYDNHEAEFLTVVIWINSTKGQQAKINEPQGFANVRAHGMLHREQIQQAMQQQAAQAALASGGAPKAKPAGEASPPKHAHPEAAPAVGGGGPAAPTAPAGM